jgi:hypothetical protein
MSITTGNIMIILVATILTLITLAFVIWEAEKQMYVLGLRPSESTSTDIAGLITLSRGLSGNVKNIKYENITKNVIYNITIRNKLVCVESFSRYTSSDCSSSAFDVSTTPGLTITDAYGFNFKMDKNDRNEITLLTLKKSGGIPGKSSII